MEVLGTSARLGEQQRDGPRIGIADVGSRLDTATVPQALDDPYHLPAAKRLKSQQSSLGQAKAERSSVDGAVWSVGRRLRVMAYLPGPMPGLYALPA